MCPFLERCFDVQVGVDVLGFTMLCGKWLMIRRVSCNTDAGERVLPGYFEGTLAKFPSMLVARML